MQGNEKAQKLVPRDFPLACAGVCGTGKVAFQHFTENYVESAV